jgi:hypothetical protein
MPTGLLPFEATRPLVDLSTAFQLNQGLESGIRQREHP